VLVVTLAIRFLRRCVPQSVLDECENDLPLPRKAKAGVCPVTCVVPFQKS
jgi:hypothetical protein